MEKILYLGEGSDYIDGLRKAIKDNLQGCELICDKDISRFNSYNIIEEHQPKIILMSHRAEKSLRRNFFHLITKVFGMKSFIILFPNKESVVETPRTSTIGDYIYWITNPSYDEVIEYMAEKLKLKSNQVIHFPKAYYSDKISLHQCFYVSSLNRNHAQIETNRYFENDTIIDLNFPYHQMTFNSNKHKVTKRSETDIGSHFKYKYSLQYMLHTKKMNPSERSKMIKDLRYEVSTKPINEEIFQAIVEATKEKKFSVIEPVVTTTKKTEEDDYLKELETLSLTVYFNWLIEESNKQSQKYKSFVTVYDRSKKLLGMDLKSLESNFIQFFHRKEIINSQENMLKDYPSFIIVVLDEVNTIEKVKEMIGGITQLKDQFPLVILFNEHGDRSLDDLRHYLEYHFVVSTPNELDLNLIVKMFQLYQDKKFNKELDKHKKTLRDLRDKYPEFFLYEENVLINHNIFKDIEDNNSLAVYDVPAEIIWLSERQMRFKSQILIEVGELFRIKSPFDMQIEVCSREDSLHSHYEYTAHLHFLSQFNRDDLKAFVTKIATYNTNEIVISSNELKSIKETYFNLNLALGL